MYFFIKKTINRWFLKKKHFTKQSLPELKKKKENLDAILSDLEDIEERLKDINK